MDFLRNFFKEPINLYDDSLDTIKKLDSPQLDQLIDEDVFEHYLYNQKNEHIYHILENSTRFKDYFQDDDLMKCIFHDDNYELFEYLIKNGYYNYQFGLNRLLLYISENDPDKSYFKWAQYLLDHGNVPIKLLEIHNGAYLNPN